MARPEPGEPPYESWVDRRIREAQERGEFDDLPGSGKPLADLDAPYDELWWVKKLVRREQLSLRASVAEPRTDADETCDGCAQPPENRAGQAAHPADALAGGDPHPRPVSWLRRWWRVCIARADGGVRALRRR